MSTFTTKPLAQVSVTDEEKAEWKDQFTALSTINEGQKQMVL